MEVERLLLLPLIALQIVWLAGYFFPPINHDVAAILDVSARWVNGEKLYVEVIDENRLARIQRSAGLASQPVRTRAVGRGVFGMSASVAIPQRSVSAMRALYQFMNRLMLREMVRNTNMISAIASIACPVWFSVVFATETMSW